MSRCRSYHHGDLRNALILAAVELIEERGSPDFALSEAARRAGVSAAAPYRHFKDREALLEAVSELCFIGLGEAALATRAAWPEGSRECIIDLGRTYIEYVSARPAFYNLMWGQDIVHQRADLDNEHRPGFNTFLGAVEAWCVKRGLPECNPLDLAIKLWAMAHGLAVLRINGQIDLFMPEADVKELIASSANTFLDGVEGLVN
jgi:AcrR family transcriptional regulator